MNYADKVRSILAKRQMGTGKLGNVVGGRPKASGADNMKVPMASGEYVLPKEFVDHVGADKLDQMVQGTLGTLKPPDGSPQKGFRRGGERGPYDINDTFPLPTGGVNSGNPSTVARGNDPTPPIGGLDIPPADMRDPFRFEDSNSGNPWDGLDGRNRTWAMTTYGQNPWMFGGLAPQAFNPPLGTPNPNGIPTQIPAYFNPQGYPYAQPSPGGPDTSRGGPHPHTPQKNRS